MASLRRLPDCKNWIACFTNETGRRLQRSTATTNRKDAERIAYQYEEVARRMKTEAQIRRVMSDLYETISGSPLPSGSIRKFLEGWIDRKRVENAERTAERYEGVISKFIEHLGSRCDLDLTYLSPADVLAFRDSLLKRVGSGTVNQNLKILGVALNQAKREGLITVNPASQIMRIKRRTDEVDRRPFTLPELQRILEIADPEWRGMIAFGLYTGQRLSDIARLTWSNIDMVRQEIRLLTGKTRRRMVLPIAGPLLSYVATLPSSDNPEQPLFPRLHATVTRRDRAGTLSNQFHALLVKAGLAKQRTHRGTGKGRGAKRNASEISFHSLRHTATSLLKGAGVSDAVAREFIGHDSSAISRHYTHIEMGALREAARKLPDLFSE
jgi:integrase